MTDAIKRGLYAMMDPLDKLLRSVIAKGDLLSPVGENEWEALSETPRYTLEKLLAQCDVNAPEMQDVMDWQGLKRTGREQ